MDSLLSLYPVNLLAQAQPGRFQSVVDELARTPLSEVVVFVAILTAVRLICAPYLGRTAPHLRGGLYGTVKLVNEILDAVIYAAVFVFLLIRPFALQAFLIPSGSMVSTLLVNDFIVANKGIYRFSDPKPGDIVVFRPPIRAVRPEQLDTDGKVKIDFIKRCVGGPGDRIEIRDDVLYRNGKPVQESYRHFTSSPDGIRFRELTPQEMSERTKTNFKLVRWNGELIPLNYTEFDANSAQPRANLFEMTPYAVAPEFQISDPAEQEMAKQLPAEPIPPGYYLMMGDNRNGSFDSRGWGLVPRDAIVGRSEVIWLPLNRWRWTR
jgi:signal peptidase I